MILAADDENLVVELVSGAVLGRFQADVVVGIGRVPVQSVWNRTTRNARADDVGTIGCLFAVDDQPVVDRSIGADHDIVGADNMAVARRDARGLAVLDFLGVNARVDLSSVAEDRARQSFQVLERMEGCLPRKAKRRPAVPEAERNAIDELGVVDPGAMRCLELALEIFSLGVTAEEEIAFDALELAIDVFHGGDRLDAMDCRHVTLGSQARAFFAVNLRNVVVAVVQSRRQMGCGAAGLSTTDGPIVYEHNCSAGAREQVRGSHPRDSSADHADVRPQILRQWLKLRNFGCSHPDGGRMT